MNDHVIPQADHYIVVVEAWSCAKLYRVNKDKTCSCGMKQCEHVCAVRDYLKGGGSRESRDFQPMSYTQYLAARMKSESVIIGRCPVCNGLTESTSYGWRCENNLGHFWQYSGEERKIKDFLTKPHPNKQGAFYESQN